MVSHKKQVKRLKKDAQRLWDDQQALLTRANGVARDAWPHAQKAAKDLLDQGVPGVRTAVVDRAEKVAPVVGKAGKAAGAYAASTSKDALNGVLLPAVTSAVSAAVAIAEEAGSRLGLSDGVVKQGEKVTKRLDSVTKSGHKAGVKGGAKLRAAAKAGGKAAKHATGRDKGIGAGGVIGILLGVGLLAGIGYAVWQTLRADDDLWVADEDPDTTSNS
ncbi:hypothetical protein [Amnibacterium kyonggiense]|uniref:DNA helicase n=1 Tax=Amnibacterium kyonggiense TaxID=595671 RepID=A0A4R7FQ56_9MICO|nr:hypothetical protein [Amnibacterium kyonggiense]TDS79816.1 hypothetical protein CLV52_0359 [Amnibacterium kyonggiense]